MDNKEVMGYRGRNINEKLANMIQDGKLPKIITDKFPNLPKTKSQLTDIWNKANKEKVAKAEPLELEAKKYKTAEEFVGAEERKMNRVGLEKAVEYGQNPPKGLAKSGTYYHVVPKDYVSGDLISGKKLGDKFINKWGETFDYTKTPDYKTVSLFDNIDQAFEFNTSFLYGEGKILKIRTAKSLKRNREGYATRQNIPQDWIEGEVNIKSQLTDIWNKANAEVGSSSLTEENILATMAEMKSSPELVDPIIAQVKETLPVFNLTGNWERKYIRRLMPFYNRPERPEPTVEIIECDHCGKKIEILLEWWWDTGLAKPEWIQSTPETCDRYSRLCQQCLNRKLVYQERAQEYMSDNPPGWFDPADAGEQWDNDY